jgi:hypothetical protein
MSAAVLLVLVGTPLLLAVIATVAVSFTRPRTDTRHEWRLVQATWVGAALVGGVVAWWINDHLDLGRGAMLVPGVLGLFVVVGVGLGEAVVRPLRPSGPRTASLAARRVADYLPRALTVGVAGITTLHVAALSLTTVTASTDDMGRAGRQVAARCGDMSSGAGPYPGSFYSVPLAALLVVIGLAAAAAMTTVVRRPRGFAPDDVADDVLRRRSTTRVLAAAGAAVSASHVGVAFFAATALLRMDCQSIWMDPAGWVLLATVPLALVLLGWFLGRIVAPGALTAVLSAHPAVTR